MRWFKNRTRCDEVNTLLQGLPLPSPSLTATLPLLPPQERPISPPLPPANPHHFDEPADLVGQACVRGSTSTPLRATTTPVLVPTSVASQQPLLQPPPLTSASVPQPPLLTSVPQQLILTSTVSQPLVPTATVSRTTEWRRRKAAAAAAAGSGGDTSSSTSVQPPSKRKVYTCRICQQPFSKGNVTSLYLYVIIIFYLQEIITLSTVGLAIAHRLTLECLWQTG